MPIRRLKLLAILVLLSCQPDLTDDPIPLTTFPTIEINLSLPENLPLRTDGGFKEISGGVRGIILYRVNETNFRAYERNCSFQPNQAGSTVNIHSSSLYLIDDSCGSTFSLDQGTPTGGPAWRPLRRYRTEAMSYRVIITDEILN